MARAVVPLNFNAFLEKAKLKDDGGISYHLYRLHVMFIFYASYLALIDGSIIR